MASDTVIVTPAQLTRFAEFLEESSKRMRSEGRKMRESVSAARIVWRDAKYDAFHRQLENCVDDLEKFNSVGQKYADFLREKAVLANKFLQRG